MTCAGVGDLRVVLSPQAVPAPALPGGVSLRTAYRVTDSRTSAAISGGESGDISCGEAPVRGVLFGALSSGPAPAGVVAGDRFDGSVIISLVTTEPRTLAAPLVSGAGTPFPFAAALQSYVAGRSGRVSAAVYDSRTGATYSYNAGTKHMTASIVKVAILGTLMRKAQDAHRSLTTSERSLATRMIEVSDNAAATALWNEVGKGPGVKVFMNRVGMPSTTPGPDGLWGLTSTNAPDQVRLVRTVAYPNAVLTAASRGYIEALMRAVTPSQRWGVSAGVAAGTTVALKNGWLPRTDGWVINSIGHVRGGARDYVIAVLQSGDPGMSYGITTAQRVSAMVWAGLPSLGVMSPGDFTGDGRSDLLAFTNTGDMFLYRGNGLGGFTGTRTKIGIGWNAFTKVCTPGDFTGDGKADLLAIKSNGDLLLYRGNGVGGFTGGGVRIGTGWGGFTKVFSPRDFTGDARSDLLAINSGGDLLLYRGNGVGGFTGAGVRIGTGWGGFTKVFSPRDFTGDAKSDLLAINGGGDLLLYRGNGLGVFTGSALKIGVSWGSFVNVFSPGDFTGDGRSDLLTINPVGDLILYRGNGLGVFSGGASRIGTGWNAYS